MPTQNTTKPRLKREEIVAKVVAFETARAEGMSQREFARQHGVARTTLRHWHARKNGLDSSPALVAFFESPDGLAFLHRLIIALEFVIRFLGGAGLRMVQEVIRLAGLEPFVANSVGSRQQVGEAMEQGIVQYAKLERTRLTKTMSARQITACADETFHPAICLVAIEPVSGYILLEAYVDGRDAKTWQTTWTEAVAGLPVQVIQVTSDEGKGLVAFVRHDLGGHHSPDVFHVQQELTRATSVGLARRVKEATDVQAKAKAATAAVEAAAAAYAAARHGPGRPPDFKVRVASAKAAEAAPTAALEVAEAQQVQARDAIRGLGDAYHPVDLQTGALRTPTQLAQDIAAHFEALRTVAAEAALPARSLDGIAKAERVVPAMVETATFFYQQVAARLAALDLTRPELSLLQARLIPAAYLDRVAPKSRTAEVKRAVRQLAARLHTDAEPLLASLDDERRARLEQAAQECADIFQRSSSCVEGRNGRLALQHHSLHALSDTRLEALTAVHNFYITRSDGTTAAERFFGTKPVNLFDWLLDHLELPARPASKRTRARPAA